MFYKAKLISLINKFRLQIKDKFDEKNTDSRCCVNDVSWLPAN